MDSPFFQQRALTPDGEALVVSPDGEALRLPRFRGWIPEVEERLLAVLRSPAARGRDVVFDFDNTIQCRDIGEPVSALLALGGRLQRWDIPAGIALRQPATPTRLSGGIVRRYQEAVTTPGHCASGNGDQAVAEDARHADTYSWQTWIMTGISPLEVLEAARAVYSQGSGAGAAESELVRGTPFLRPYLYAPMVRLVAEVLQAEARPWIISASNVWAVREVVATVLNPALRALGVEGVPPEQVIGINALLDDGGRLVSDAALVASDPSYRALDPERLARLTITDRLCYPTSTFDGKALLVRERIERPPLLVCGDSANDLPMLRLAEHRLWLARLESPRLQQRVHAELRGTAADQWLVQPVLTQRSSGFVAYPRKLREVCTGPGANGRPGAVASSIDLLFGA